MAEPITGPRAIVGIRRRTVEVSTGLWEREWRAYFRGLERRFLASSWKSADPGAFHVKQAGPGSGFWANENRIAKELLDKQYLQMTETVWKDVVSKQVGTALAFDLNARGVGRILDKVGTRITGMTESSQMRLSWRIESGINAGQSTDKIEGTVRDLLRSWGEPGNRAHIIALTETGNAYNLAATEGYRESGLVERVQVYDGPDCGWTEHDDPDLADGSTRTLEEAEEYPLSHPHCQRAFGPVVLTEEDAQAAGLEPGPAAEVQEDKPLEFTDQTSYDDYADNFLQDWRSTVGDTPAEAVGEYTGGIYDNINQGLRGSQILNEEARELIPWIDKAMVPIPDTLQVSRGVYDEAFRAVMKGEGFTSPVISERLEWLAKNLPGKVLEDKGYFSTSMTNEAVTSRPVTMRIVVPKGTKAAPARQVSVFDYEKELLLHRGVQYVVTKAEIAGGVLRVEATVIR